MKDYILRATAGNGSIRAFFATTSETVQKAYELHGTSPVVSAAFGRLLTAAVMMGSMLKGDDLLTLSLKGSGPMKGAVITCDSMARVRGYVAEPIVDIPTKPNGKLDVSGAVGKGTLSIIKDIGLKEPYMGQIPLVSGEIAEDLTHYFVKSEQIPTAVALGVLVDRDWSIKQSGGFIIQLMPGADEEIVKKLEHKLADIPPVTTLLDEGRTIEEIMQLLLGEFNVIVHESFPAMYHCNCSRERSEKALISLGVEELSKILTEDGQASLHCHFCNKDYMFSGGDIDELLKKLA